VQALIAKYIMPLIPMLLERIYQWAYNKAVEKLKQRERQRRADDLNNSKDEDEFDRATDRLS
jgi:hypothetical protein